MSDKKSLANWKDRVESYLDFRPEDSVYRIAREAYTNQELFDLEMEHIFEKTWIYACHESQVPYPNDFYTINIGRQPVIITRDAKGNLNALINACAHRGTTLTRTSKGNQSTFTCPFHAWCYKTDGRLVKVKAPEHYCDKFKKEDYNLATAKVQSYRGFVFVNLDVNTKIALEEFLSDAKIALDMMVDQSADAELEVLSGTSAYTYEGNWKLQNENGLDAYHVSTVHYNYVATVQHRAQVEQSKENGDKKETLDYSKLGAGATDIEDGWFGINNGHTLLYSDMPNPQVRPGYDEVMPRLKKEHGEEMAEWMMHKLRNLNIYPSLLFMDQISSQLRVVRPVSWNKTEVHSFCIGVKNESPKARESRIRQFEDFFNVSGMGTPDDLVEFREAQKGFEGRMAKWNDFSRGAETWIEGETKQAKFLHASPVITGVEMTQEGHYINQYNAWKRYLIDGLNAKIELESN